MGEAGRAALRLGFDRAIKLAFHGARASTIGGLFPHREPDDAARLTESGAGELRDFRTGNNIRHGMKALLRQSIYGRLAGYADVNDAQRLSVDPVMRHWSGNVRCITPPRPAARWVASRPTCSRTGTTSRCGWTCPSDGWTRSSNAGR